MFEDSLLESGKRFKTRSPLTTTISFVVQSILVGALVVIPLFAPEALPKQQLMTFLVAPAPPPPPPPPAAVALPAKVTKVVSKIDEGKLRTPTAIPKKVPIMKEEEPPPPPMTAGVIGGVVGGVPGGTAGGVLGGVLGSITTAAPAAPVPKVAPPPPPQKVKVSSGVAAGNLVHDVKPQYPPLARQARIQGTVVLQAVIDKEGRIQHLHVVSGHPWLAKAALDAVQQWRYKPYYLSGEPVEVECQINVNFTLAGG